MYFPYLRGRLYELLALKDLLEKDLLSEKVVPVIEPIKLSTTLFNALENFIEKKRKIGLILNPEVVDLSKSIMEDKKILTLIEEYEKYFYPVLLMQENTLKVVEYWEKSNINKEKWWVINTRREYIDTYNKIFSQQKPKQTFLPDEFRRKIRLENKVLLENRFNRCYRNVDYKKNVDEFFSEDHLFYSEEGYKGFGDYSIIGDEYVEGGFLPYAVVIHLVYMDTDQVLKVHHFLSKSNVDTKNPAGKFYEAVGKLSEWVNTHSENTYFSEGLKTFIKHFENQTYPGLGTVKKLSLMHHLELMGHYLETYNG